MRPRSLALLAVLVSGASAWAAPVSYNEALQGDLSSGNPAVLVIGAGINTIQGVTGFGSLEQEALNGFAGDRDSFVLRVAAGLQIERATLTMLPIAGNVFGSSWLVVRDGDFGNPIAELGQSSSAYTQSWLLELSSGDYLFHHAALGGQFDSAWSFRWDIQASPSAVPIPEPPTLALVAAAIAAGAVRRRNVSPEQGGV